MVKDEEILRREIEKRKRTGDEERKFDNVNTTLLRKGRTSGKHQVQTQASAHGIISRCRYEPEGLPGINISALKSVAIMLGSTRSMRPVA